MSDPLRYLAPVDSFASTTRNQDDLRRSNLGSVLSLLHGHGAMSRAELTRSTGLNRSTVAKLVGELESRGLVSVSSPVDTGSKGRPSVQVHATSLPIALAVYPEADVTTIGVVTLGGRLLRQVRFEHERPPSPTEVRNAVRAVLDGMRPDLEKRHFITGLAVAIPGLVSTAESVIRAAPRLGWVDVRVSPGVDVELGIPVWIANDAACGVTAEMMFGAARGSRDVVLLHGGLSGISGGTISGGELLTGVSGYAGEWGHTLVKTGGVKCRCGARGCLEAELRFSDLQAFAEHFQSDPYYFEIGISNAFRDNPEARALVERDVDVLVVALRNIVHALNPEVIVLGGFLGILLELTGDRLISGLRGNTLPGQTEHLRVRRSLPDRTRILLGAGELAFAGLLKDPLALVVDSDWPADRP